MKSLSNGPRAKAARRSAAAGRLFAAALLVVGTLGGGTALGAEFQARDGSSVVGEIVYAGSSTIMVREGSGAFTQLGRRSLERVALKTDKGIVSGVLLSWSDGVYEIDAGDRIVKIKDRKLVAEQRVFPKVIVGAAQSRENGSEVVFDLVLSKPTKQEVLLLYSTADGSAEAGSDYQAARGSVLLAPGSVNAMVRVPLLDDEVKEGDESFELLVTSDLDPDNVEVQRGTATIYDNDQ